MVQYEEITNPMQFEVLKKYKIQVVPNDIADDIENLMVYNGIYEYIGKNNAHNIYRFRSQNGNEIHITTESVNNSFGIFYYNNDIYLFDINDDEEVDLDFDIIDVKIYRIITDIENLNTALQTTDGTIPGLPYDMTMEIKKYLGGKKSKKYVKKYKSKSKKNKTKKNRKNRIKKGKKSRMKKSRNKK